MWLCILCLVHIQFRYCSSIAICVLKVVETSLIVGFIQLYTTNVHVDLVNNITHFVTELPKFIPKASSDLWMSFLNLRMSSSDGGFLATIYPKTNPLMKRIIINRGQGFYMLWSVFLSAIFVLHVFKARSKDYRRLTMRKKI